MIASITGRHVSVPVFQIGRLPWKSMPLIPGKEAVKKTVCALCFILPILHLDEAKLNLRNLKHPTCTGGWLLFTLGVADGLCL